MTRRREFWAKLVREIEGGARLCDVARRHGVNEGTLKWYRTRFRKERETAPRLLAVVPAEEPPTCHSGVVVSIEGVRVELPQGTDVGYVAALIAAIRPC